jgi:hypothetical protein
VVGYILLTLLHLLWLAALAAMVTVAYRNEEPYSERLLEAAFALLLAAVYASMAIGAL